LIGFGNLVGSLSHPVLYLHGVLPQHSPSSDFGENQLSRGLISLSLLLSSHLRIFQHSRVRSFIWCYPNFNLLKSRSPPLRVYCQQLVALFTLGFPSPPSLSRLKLTPLTITRRLIMQKASRHHALRHGSDTLYAWGCRYYFTPLAGVLFTFPSRYSFTIGCQGVFSLIRWSGRIHAEFHVHRITWDPSRGTNNFAHPAVTVFGRSFQIVKLAVYPPTFKVPQPRKYKYSRFRLFRFRSPLLTESLSFSFPGVTEMFHFAPFSFVGL
jgi:hypothetical protein